MMKKKVLTRRNTLLRQIKRCTDNNLNLGKVNMIDPTKDNFTYPLSIKEILDELKMSKDYYNRALSISKDEDLKLNLKRKSNSCIADNDFDVGLKAMNIPPIFNEYKAVTYVCQYFSKTEDRCSQAVRQAVKEGFENNMHHQHTMKTIAKAYLSNQECSAQEAVYHILPK